MCVHIFQRALDCLIKIITDVSKIDDEVKVSYMCYLLKEKQKLQPASESYR